MAYPGPQYYQMHNGPRQSGSNPVQSSSSQPSGSNYPQLNYPNYPPNSYGQIYPNYAQPYQPPQSNLQPLPLNNNVDNKSLLYKKNVRSNYPLVQWSKIYLNIDNNFNTSNSIDVQSLNIDKIPTTQVDVDCLFEMDIINDIESVREKDTSIEEECLKRKQEHEDKIQSEQLQKIATFTSITNITDSDKARKLLEKYAWDLEKVASIVTSKDSQIDLDALINSNPDLSSSINQSLSSSLSSSSSSSSSSSQSYQNSYGMQQQQPPQPPLQSLQQQIPTTTITILLPDTKQYVYQVPIDETFWGLYGRISQLAPDLSNKNFTFCLYNNKKLNENEFDQTLQQAGLVPQGTISIVLL